MIGIFVIGPQNAVIAVGQLVFGNPVIFVRVSTAFCHNASDQSRMSDIQLKPLIVYFKNRGYLNENRKQRANLFFLQSRFFGHQPLLLNKKPSLGWHERFRLIGNVLDAFILPYGGLPSN
jgi:hypothetical protein